MYCSSKKSFYIIVLFSVTFLFFYLFSSICFPFAVGFILAYLFMPLIGKFSQKMNRTFLCFILAILSVTIFIIAGFQLLPKLKQYVIYLADTLPTYYDNFSGLVNKIFGTENISQYQSEIDSVKLELQKYFDQKILIAASILKSLVASKNTIASFFSFFIIMPISFFYFARDWELVSTKIYDFIPQRQHVLVNEIFSVIKKSFFKFIKAQIYVVVILSTYYASILFAIGIQHSTWLGMLSGLLSFIPFIGALLAAFVVIFISVPYLTLSKFYLIIVLYFCGQCIEGYILSPKFVGKGTGIHPLWILFSFFAGYQLLGIFGVLIAIPVVSVCRGLINLYISKFKASSIYKQ